jgi:hypothetical protein
MSDFEILGYKNYVPFITKITIEDWGQTTILDCVCTPEKIKPYRIFFIDCEEIQWIFHKNEIDCLDDDNVVDVLDFHIAKQSNKNKITLYAHIVELYLICENIKVEKDW